MSFITNFLGLGRDPREELRPLWHAVAAHSRAPHWYRREGVADTVAGRFDMVAAVLALVLLRMEKDAALAPSSALLTELFVEDMDWQLRESGIGDLMVGKHVGRLVGVLGGRLGAFRDGLARGDDQALARAVERNVSLVESADPTVLAASLRRLHNAIAEVSAVDLLAGRLA